MRDLLEDIDDGWFSDADDTVPQRLPCICEALDWEVLDLPAPGALTPMPLPRHTRLGTAQEANDSAQVPKTPWFSEMRSLVPRRRPSPATRPAIPRAIRASARIEIPSTSDESVVTKVLAEQKSWWRRK